MAKFLVIERELAMRFIYIKCNVSIVNEVMIYSIFLVLLLATCSNFRYLVGEGGNVNKGLDIKYMAHLSTSIDMLDITAQK